MRIQFGTVDVHFYFLRDTLFVGREQVELLLIYIIYTLELHSLIDRPAQRTHLYLQFLLQFVEQVERVAAFTVHLVDEYDYRCLPHAAHRHQFSRLCLHTLGTVHHDNGRVYSRQRTERIFGKILVTGCVEDVDLISFVVKFHHRCGHRDTALFLYIHPVGCGCLLYFIALHRSGHLYLAAEEQEFLGKRSLTGVRMRYDRKCPSSFYFVVHMILDTDHAGCPYLQ